MNAQQHLYNQQAFTSCVSSPNMSQQMYQGGYSAREVELMAQLQASGTAYQQPKGKSVFSEIAGDIKTFFLQHRGVIYFIIAALIIDHIFFKDAFRLRLQGMADKIVAKVENKIAA